MIEKEGKIIAQGTNLVAMINNDPTASCRSGGNQETLRLILMILTFRVREIYTSCEPCPDVS